MIIKIICSIFSVVLYFNAVNSYAYTVGNVSIHGFGGWAYTKTDNENSYLNGTKDGNYETFNFSLNISAKPYEQLTIYIQPGFNEDRNENEVEMDYAFAEWSFSDALKFRAGKVKAPFMFCTEVYDVGTIRPFFFLPGLYQELVAEAYKGGGITGSFTRWEWELMYDIYGGKLDLLPKYVYTSQAYDFVSTTPIVSDMIGGRMIINPPLEGIGFGFSFYTGDTEFERDGLPNDESIADKYTIFGFSGEYQTDSWRVRCEYLLQKDSPKLDMDLFYAETAYKFTEHWQLALRYEFANFSVNTSEIQSIDTLTKHREIALGFNYWFNSNLIFKCSYHYIYGNLLADPETPEEYIMALMQGFDKDTSLIVFGVQFSF